MATATAPAATTLFATVTVQANLRRGPGTNFTILEVLPVGSSVALRGQVEGWYQVRTSSGVLGWMSTEVLAVDPDAAVVIPTVQP